MTQHPVPDVELDSSDEAVAAWLQANGKLKDADLERARRLASADSAALTTLLPKLGLVTEADMASAFAAVTGTRLLAAEDYPDFCEMPEGVSVRFLRDAPAVPLEVDDQRLLVAVTDPRSGFLRNSLAMASGRRVEVVVGLPGDIRRTLDHYLGDDEDTNQSGLGLSVDGEDGATEEDIEHLRDMASEAPVIRLVNLVLQRAVESRASDVHIEPFDNELKVRYRIDGVLHEVEAPPAQSAAAVISRVKIMARLNIAERRLPQDGRIKVRVAGRELDLRVSTTPTLHGESVVMRLLDKESVTLEFEALGFEGKALERLRSVLDLPHGIMLVTGPTGSGKSTTLYTALQRLNTPERKVITVEDPVEYELDGVNQIQVKPQIGLNFASALRSIVRQDPDIIMIGEMRDLETAQIAVQSALTGHLVLSTLHTNDAAGSVNRMLDMGVDDYLLASTVNGILAQRLVRRLCPHCAEPYTESAALLEQIGVPADAAVDLRRPVGCESCSHTGFRGRLAINELLVMSERLREAVVRHASSQEVDRIAREEGMVSMYEDGISKAVRGLTTTDEVLRVTRE
ncbi:type II secretion system ATPase GspE [Arhodomonas sp. AD133]|uniref:type II secretion system ATPase GspE n=1 Tax=Arhodomonas sp. AD133 TaxID=3415009 RepID=UPI003EB921B3